MRERWRRHVDYIMELQSRPVNFSDLVAFVDQEARIATNPVFGDISDKTQASSDSRSRRAPQTSPGFKPPKPKTSTFATQLQSSGDQNSCADVASANVQPSLCLFCQKNHALEDCHLLRWKPYQERIKFLASKRLCFGCRLTSMWQDFVLKERPANFLTVLASIPQSSTRRVIAISAQWTLVSVPGTVLKPLC